MGSRPATSDPNDPRLQAQGYFLLDLTVAYRWRFLEVGLVIENVIATLPGWQPGFYRTSAGAEVDLILERGRRRIAVECKASTVPTVSRGFWTALEDLGIDEAWVVAPVAEPYPLRKGVTVAPLRMLLDHLSRGE